jgi:hypothetical protein
MLSQKGAPALWLGAAKGLRTRNALPGISEEVQQKLLFILYRRFMKKRTPNRMYLPITTHGQS